MKTLTAPGRPDVRGYHWTALRRDCLGWLQDCFEDLPEALGDREIIEAMVRHYEGGMWGFISDSGEPAIMSGLFGDWLAHLSAGPALMLVRGGRS